jgi:excisionase family DNA binding protein
MEITFEAKVEDELIDELADAIADRVMKRMTSEREDRWLSTREAATHLGLTTNALHKLTAARAVPFEQDGAGGKMWFLRSELDAWRRK